MLPVLYGLVDSIWWTWAAYSAWLKGGLGEMGVWWIWGSLSCWEMADRGAFAAEETELTRSVARLRV
jgi:hypothetical protein